jgi:hypothetical protein
VNDGVDINIYLFNQPFKTKMEKEEDNDKLAMYQRMKVNIEAAITNMEAVVNNKSEESRVAEAKQV